MLKLCGFVTKHVEKIRRSPAIFTLLLASGAIGFFLDQPSALSQSSGFIALNPGDLVCYVQMSDGRVLNLNKWCGATQGNATATTTTDQQFLDRFQAFLSKRSSGIPALQAVIQATLLQVQKNPQAVVKRAQAVCTALRTGQPQPQTAEVANDLFETLAPNYYCPELDD